MSANFTYGAVVDGTFYSNRMERRLTAPTDNGIYSLDMDADDFWSTLTIANIQDAVSFFRKASKIHVIRGVSFHNGLIPENPVAFTKIPIAVMDGIFEEFEYVEVAIIKNRFCYFLQTLAGNEAYALMDIKERFEKGKTIADLKGLTPPMRVVFSFHSLEKKHKEELEPLNVIKSSFADSGANIRKIKPVAMGYEVIWELDGYTINTLLNKNYRVIEAGFCVSGDDRVLTARSVANVLKTYVEDGDHVHIMRVAS